LLGADPVQEADAMARRVTGTKRTPDADRLGPYRAKRDFKATPEPSGTVAVLDPSPSEPLSTGRFVVQRHRASSLHYDFRLEVAGVLASWAVPRGPSMDPAKRRLAVEVEDHPLGYIDFEGVIPGRQYGAGDVIVWDRGTFRADPDSPDAARALRDGEFKFELDGAKLTGAFVLIRTAGFGKRRSRPDDTRQKWLLIHRRDGSAIEGWEAEAFPKSVKTGRTNEDVAARRRKSK
jgi:bifunctional non-homologous end joining protein LigD